MYTSPTKEDLVVLFTTKEKKSCKCPGDCMSVSAYDIRETCVFKL